MFCDFINIEGNTYRCSVCNLTITTDDGYPPIFPCRLEKQLSSKQPSFIQKIKNFSKSIISHAENNFEMASDIEIEKRFKICESCDYFQNNSCSQCGCPVNRTKNYISKLSWSSESCPINKW